MRFKLIESSPRKQRTPLEAAVSIAVHTVLIGAFVYATAQSGEIALTTGQSVQSITFAMPKAAPKAPPAAPKRPAPPKPAAERSVAPAAPVEEPSSLQYSGAATDAAMGDTPESRGAYYEHEVGTSAAAMGGLRPRYPETLRQSAVEGRVEMEFVVDERGRVDMNTVRVIESTHALFTAAVRNALRGMRFSPAKVNGVAVRQFVRLPVVFKIQN